MLREGARHTPYFRRNTDRTSAVPRHTEKLARGWSARFARTSASTRP